jgi:hypothetical protein
MPDIGLGIRLSASGAEQVASTLGGVQGRFDSLSKGVEGFGINANSVMGTLKGLATAAIGLGSIGAFVGMIKGSIDATAALYDLSLQTGASVESLSAFSEVAKLSDTSVESVASAMNKLSKNMAVASEDSKGTAAAVKALGIDFDTFDKMNPEDRMLAVAKAMGKFADGSGKTAAAMALFGKEGAKLLPFLNDLAVAGDFQAKQTTAQAKAADDFGDNLTRLRVSGEAWKKELSNGMVPALNEAAEAMVQVISGGGGLREEVRRLAADGSIASWTRSAITGLTYVADAVEGAWRIFKIFGESLGAYSAAAMVTFSGLAEGANRALKGDFKGALDAVSNGMQQGKTVMVSFGQSIEETLGAQTFGQKLRDRMADLKGFGSTAEAQKEKLDLKATMEANAEEAKKAAAAYATLLGSYDKLATATAAKLNQQQLEIEGGRKLNAAEEDYIKVMSDVASGKVKMNDLIKTGTLAKLQDNLALAAAADALKDEAKWLADSAKESEKYTESTQKRLEGLLAETDKQREANDAMGMSKEALADLKVAKLADLAVSADQRAALLEQIEPGNALADTYRKLAAAYRESASETTRGAHLAAAQDAANEWKKTTDSIGQGLTDSLFRAFESGKGFFTTLWDGIKNLFKTTVLKLAIQGTDGKGGVGGFISKAGSALMGGLSSGFTGTASASTGGGIMGTIGSLGSTLGGFGGDVLGSMMGAGTAAGGAAGAAASALGTAIPYVAAALALYAVYKKFAGKATPHMGSVVGVDAAGSASTLYGDGSTITNNYMAETDAALRGLGGASTGALNTLSKAFGGSGGFSSVLKFAADGKDASIGGFNIKRNGTTISDFGHERGDFHKYASDREAGFAAFTADVAGATRAALDAVALPQWAREQFAKLGSAATIEQFAALADAVTATQEALRGMQTEISPLGGVFARVAGLSGDALKQLTDFAGGIEQFGQKVGNYVKNYYSAGEQAALGASSLSRALAAAGIDGGALTDRASFRALVDRTDVGSETGRQQLAALLSVSESFAPIADYLAKEGGTLASLAALAPAIGTLGDLNAGAQTATADGLATVDTSVLTAGQNTVNAIVALQTSIEAGLATIAANTGATTRRLDSWDDGGALVTTTDGGGA